jgi:starch phosphorylase
MLEEREVQLIFSGKAHPQDDIGKRIVANLVRLARQYPDAVVFLENYDMAIGRSLTRGCDVWLNNPIRPLEASGTSGMKAAMNGVLNFSVLDGWWPEGCEHGVNGWQIGGAYEGEDRDEHDLRSLMDLLKDEILPTYYGNRDRWVEMMKASIAMSEWKFSSDRMVEEYFKNLYSLEKRLRAVS